jgi:probable HAF family extracellular repeat protein
MTDYTYATLSDPLATKATAAQGINDTGQIVGWYQPQINSDAVYGFLYSGGNYASLTYVLNVAPGSTASFNTYAFGINERR